MGIQGAADLDGEDEAIFSEINITPLTDIFLVLVIILIISGSAAVDKVKQDRVESKSAGLKINLPAGEARQIDSGSKSLIVSIDEAGVVQVNDTRVRGKDVERMFQAAFTRNASTQVVIRADTSVSHGRVVHIMEVAKRVGLSRFVIATAAE